MHLDALRRPCMLKKIKLRTAVLVLFQLICAGSLCAQNTTPEARVFVASGMGFGFPAGKIKQTLKPKFSSSVGLNIPTQGKLFYYPALEFLRFGYDEQISSPEYTYRLRKGTANIYNLSFMPGYAETLGHLKLYGFAGPSLQWVHEPRSRVDASAGLVHLEKIKYFTGGARAGLGAHYRSGNFYLFIETSWEHNFHDMQGQSVHVITLFGGLKTDVTTVAEKLGALLSGDGVK